MNKLQLYFLYILAVPILIFAGCKKKAAVVAPPDPVDAIAGIYSGTLHYIDSNNVTATPSTLDTTYRTTVIISKAGFGSFSIVSQLNWFIYTPFNSPIKYDHNSFGDASTAQVIFKPSADSIYVHVFFSQSQLPVTSTNRAWIETFSGKNNP